MRIKKKEDRRRSRGRRENHHPPEAGCLRPAPQSRWHRGCL